MRSPKNRIVIGGVDVFNEFDLVIEDGFELPLAKAKTYCIDVPGGNGTIDLTASHGDVVYENRTMVFTLAKLGAFLPSEFEAVKTRFANFLNGRRFDFAITIDPGYMYSGRFSVDDAYSTMHIGRIKVSVDAEPYKLRETCTYRVNAAGGVTINLACGRKRVCPTIEVNHRALVSMHGRTWVLEPGASRIRDLWLSGDPNIITIDTYPEYCVTYWTDYAGKTWADLAGKRWSEVGAGSQPLQEGSPWSDYVGKTWADLAGKRWVELMHPATPGDEYAAYIQFDWSDL